MEDTQVQTQQTEETQATPAENAEVQPAETAVEEPQTGVCDSCGQTAVLFDVPHHQEGNDTVWHYCESCKAIHEKEGATLANLKELQKTHPAEVNRPDVAGMFNQGKTLDEVKLFLDTNRQPSLEAEVQQ